MSEPNEIHKRIDEFLKCGEFSENDEMWKLVNDCGCRIFHLEQMIGNIQGTAYMKLIEQDGLKILEAKIADQAKEIEYLRNLVKDQP